MKKILSLVLALVMLCLVFASCGGKEETAAAAYGFDGTKELAQIGVVNTVASAVAAGTAVADFKIGCIMVGDESEGYTEAHMKGINDACAALGIDPDTQVIWKKKIGEDESCTEACRELVASGCKLVLANSYGHQDFVLQAAKEYPEVTFISATGDKAATSGLSNYCNAFTAVYESRYASGVVAGMKLKELIDAGKIPAASKDDKGNIKIGYVGAYNYAEVVSGYTAFYLGIKSIVSNVVMSVQYTNSWFDLDKEYATAKALMDAGCVIIGQHADSTGAPTAVQEYRNAGKEVYSVGYNVDMLGVAPDAALTSATNNWEIYYEYAFKTAMYGGKVAPNWCGGYQQNAVAITDLGASCAAGTAEKVAEVISALKAGTLHVFDTSKFTLEGGKTVTYAYASDTDGDWTNDANNAIADGYYHESYVQSAPSFSLRIDGITELSGN